MQGLRKRPLCVILQYHDPDTGGQNRKMEQKRNYQKELDKIIAGLGDEVPTLLLHACCAPCSSYVLEYLTQYFKIKVLYYNPNIDDPAEYEKRVLELKRLISAVDYK